MGFKQITRVVVKKRMIWSSESIKDYRGKLKVIGRIGSRWLR
jgi:hypothetical protein